MMKRILQILTAATATAGLVLLVATPAPQVDAACTGAQCAKDGADKVDTGGGGTTLDSALKTVVNILLFFIGAVAVIMIVIGGIKYTTSNGDQNQLTSAKNTILYAVVGLVVAIMAYAIVQFVIDAFL